MDQFKEKIKKLHTDYHEAVAKEANQYYRDVIVPVCKKFHLKFLTSSRWHYLFVTKGNYRILKLDDLTNPKISNKLAAELKEIIKVLEISVEHDSLLFGDFIVGDIHL